MRTANGDRAGRLSVCGREIREGGIRALSGGIAWIPPAKAPRFIAFL